MSLFSRLFGGGGSDAEESKPSGEDHEGFTITVAPIKEDAGYRVSAHIEKTIGDAVKKHHLIRADVCNSKEEAARVSLLKAKSLIDQMGDGLF